MGIQRSTFLINEESKIEYIWEKVKVKGHVEDVINKIKWVFPYTIKLLLMIIQILLINCQGIILLSTIFY